MVRIRLHRTGTTKRPMYRIVAIDSRSGRQARPLETLGTYDPRHGGRFSLREDAVKSWLAKGALPSETVASLLRRKAREQPAGEPASGAEA